MRIFKPVLITLLAACLAASGVFARAAKTTTHGKSPSLSASAKKRKTSASPGSKKHVKNHGASAHAALGEHFEGSFDIPPEDLPVGDDEDSPNP